MSLYGMTTSEYLVLCCQCFLLTPFQRHLLLENHAAEGIDSSNFTNGNAIQLGHNQAVPTTASRENGSLNHSGSFYQNESPDSLENRSLRRSKRKRKPTSLSFTRKISSKISDLSPIDFKGKGKAKEINEGDDAKADNSPGTGAPGENGSSGSGATIARMLHLSSQNSSRASSVTSSAESPLQSPTLKRQSSSTNGRLTGPTLFHHHRPPATSRASAQNLKRSVSSSSSQARDPATSQPSPSQRATPTQSPVTRSMCRFHRISLPREENGPRVSFIIPGCSLGNKTLMDNEGIVDHGDATTLDHERMVGDIETLDFSSYLMGVLRQLVGVDLLRENEVFFLPQPGESYGNKRHGKAKATVAKASSGDFAASASPQSTTSSFRGSTSRVKLGPPVPRTSLSSTGSASTSAGTKPRGSERPSISTDDGLTESEPEDSVSSQPKRRRENVSIKQSGVASSEEMPPPTSGTAPGKRTARRSKRLSLDAHAYKPGPEAEETSTDPDSDAKKSRRKRAGKRGIKRSRTSEFADPDEKAEGRTIKRSKHRLNMSSSMT